MNRITLITKPQTEYELLDSGREEKLERYGRFVLSRPDPQALWDKSLVAGEWAAAQGLFERSGKNGVWRLKDKALEKGWPIEFGGLRFLIKPTSFKHVGLFPEQLSNWEWLAKLVEEGRSARQNSLAQLPSRKEDTEDFLKSTSSQITVLNLFGYTGGATLAAAKAGAEVVHVDASKTAVAWAHENAKLSYLKEASVHWVVEDALVYLRRELKRGKRYDAIIMDPPAFGHGPKNELWKFEEHFLELMRLSLEILSDKPLFVLMNGYAAGYSPLMFAYNLEPFVKKFGGSIEYGDLTIEQSKSDRLLPCGIFARWQSN